MTVGRPGKTHAYAAAQSMRMVRQRMESDDAVKDFWRYMATLSAAVGVANGAVSLSLLLLHGPPALTRVLRRYWPATCAAQKLTSCI